MCRWRSSFAEENAFCALFKRFPEPTIDLEPAVGGPYKGPCICHVPKFAEAFVAKFKGKVAVLVGGGGMVESFDFDALGATEGGVEAIYVDGFFPEELV